MNRRDGDDHVEDLLEREILSKLAGALIDANGPAGTFSNEDGPLPW